MALRRDVVLVLSVVFASLTLLACAEEEQSSESCVTNQQFFAEEVWTKVLGSDCIACHNPQGVAKDTDFILQDAYQTGFLDANYAHFADVVQYEKDGEALVILKPLGGDNHGGDVRFAEGDERFQIVSEMIDRYDSPVSSCGTEEASLEEQLTLMTPVETLRKASLSLVGRLPTATEIQVVEEGGLYGLDAVLLKQMEEPAFANRVREIYNDLFLTDRYFPGDDAVSLLDEGDYPNLWWYDPGRYGDDPPPLEAVDGSYAELGDRYANRAVAREAIELVVHIIQNDRPFTEIVTADYMIANPFSARVYGVHDQIEWTDSTDPNEWREVAIPGVNHAGVLTSHMWLNRFPTTDTNLNRHRARMVFEFFLASDVLKLAERPIDPSAIQVHNPTMNAPDCAVCHSNIDPIAGTFQNWDDEGRLRPAEEGWVASLRPPGYGTIEQPLTDSYRSLQWLGEQLVQDPRFTTAAVHTWYEALSGRAALGAPTDFTDESYTELMRLYLEQDEAFQKIGAEFAEDWNIKTVILGIVRSPYYRATNVELDADQLADPLIDAKTNAYGTARWLTPEMLNRKIVAITGYPWERRDGDPDYLLDINRYRIFYGGIDSDSIIARITEPNGLMGNVAARMANQMSCLAAPQDFVLPAEERLLFPHVEVGFTPEDENGFEVAQSVTAIRQNIQHLYSHILGEELDINAAEIDAAYQLFYDTWQDGRAAVAADEVSSDLMGECRADDNYWTGEDYSDEVRVINDGDYTVRAWMAVVTYLLSDYRFLHE